jgi:GntR family transcriptional regulator
MDIQSLILDFQSSELLHEQIASRLREQLLRGRAQQGERLPTVRELAKELGVHFNTVARAYRQLEIEGWLSTRPGRGTFVWRNEQAITKHPQVRLGVLTTHYVEQCRQNGYSEMDILRELRKHMLSNPERKI